MTAILTRSGVAKMPADPDLIPGILARWGLGQKRRLRRAFDVGGQQEHGGKRWVPLAPATGTGTPLKDSGSLKRSIFAKVSGVSVLFGSNSPIAIYHQNGTRTIPKRPVVVLTRRDLTMLKNDLKKTLEA